MLVVVVVSTGISVTDNEWHFICMSWMSANGYYEIHLDGSLTNAGQNLSRNGRIEANGSLMLGQEQVTIPLELYVKFKNKITCHPFIKGRCWFRVKCSSIIRWTNGLPRYMGPIYILIGRV